MTTKGSGDSEMVEHPDLRRLTGRVAMSSLRLTSSAAQLVEFKERDSLAELKLELFAGAERGDNPKATDAFWLMRVYCGAKATYLPEAASSRELVRLECDYAIEYRVSDLDLYDRATEELLEQFARTNGLYNAWPYFREYCQSMLTRMMLPAPPLPPFLLNNIKPQD